MSLENKRGQTAGAMAVKRLQDDIGAYLTEQDRELVQGPMFLLPRLTKAIQVIVSDYIGASRGRSPDPV